MRCAIHRTGTHATLRHRAFVLAVAAALAISGLANTGRAGELAAVEARAAPALALTGLDGRILSLDGLHGSVVVVNFWASWCTPCVREMPSLVRLRERMRGLPFEVIGVNVAEGVLRARTASRRLQLDFPVLLDRDSAVFNRWDAAVLPTTFVIDRAGRLRYRVTGSMEWDRDEVVATLQALAAQSPGDG